MTASYTTLERQQSYGRTSTPSRKGNVVINWITTTDHKTIGYLYLITSFLFFCLGGVMALVIRAQLFEPGEALVGTPEQYNQLLTMHGTIMLLMFAPPRVPGLRPRRGR